MAAAKIQVKRANAAAWTSANTVLFAGEIGLELDTFKFKIGNGATAWNSLAYSISSNLSASTLNDLGDVTITSATDGDFLRWNGTAWINDAVNLSTDTIGSYVQSLVAGTGVTLADNSGEGATPTVTVDTSVIQERVANVTDTEIGYLDGVTSAIQTQIDTKAPTASPTFTGTVTVPDNTITLGTKTTGDYVQSLVAGTGVTLSNNSGETATPTVAIGQAVGTSASVQFAAVTAPLIGNASTATALQTARNIAGQAFNGSANISIAPTDLTGVTSTAAELNILDGAILSTAELNYVDGVTSAIQTQMDLKAPLASPTFTGTVSGVTATMVGLGNVDDTSDANKPVSTAAQTALDLKAPLASPALTGTPTAPTAAAATDTTQVATTAFVRAEVAALVGSAGATLDTLGEIATALGNDENLSTTLTTSIGLKAPLASPTFTGTVSGVTATMVGLGSVDNTADADKPVSTTQQTALDLKADIASPTFTGTVSGVTATMVGLGNVDNTSNATERATTATLTNKTLTSPVINTPTGIVKGDVGLENVDNTSDATKDAATATLTNKTLTSPVVNTPTGIVKDDVGLGSVDNTADTAKPVSTDQQTALDLKANLASPTFTGTVTIPSGASISGFAPLASPTFTGTVTVPDNTVALGIKTTGDYVSSLVAGTGVTLTNNSGETATPTVAIGQAVGTSASVTFANLTLSGDLIVSGSTTSINTETLTIDDNIIVLNNNATGAPSQNAGIEIERGSSDNVALRWNETSDKWEVTEDGSTYLDIATVAYVDGQTILSLDDIGDVTITSASSGQFLKWNGTAWVNDAIPVINNIDDITGVTITAAADKDFLMYNGTAWVDSPITLGTDTTGSYVTSLVAGTGVTLANNSGESATPTVTVDTTVIAPLASPTFTGTPTLPTGTIATTQTTGDSTTKVATTAFVSTAVSLTTDSTTLLDGGNAFTIQYNSLGPVINAGSI